MPLVRIHFMPVIHPQLMKAPLGWQKVLQELEEEISEAVGSLGIRGLAANEVMVDFVPTICSSEEGKRLVAVVEGLFAQPDRTVEVVKRICDAINMCLRSFAIAYLPDCKQFETFPASLLDPRLLSCYPPLDPTE